MDVRELKDMLENADDDAEVVLVIGGYRSRTVSHVDATAIAYTPKGEFEDSLPEGERFYIVEGGQRRDNPYLTEEEHDELDYVLG